MPQEGYSEKVSVNMNASTLSAIDLLVDGGYYSNRSDFINQAVRDALQARSATVERLITTKEAAAKRSKDSWFIGISGLTAREIAEMDAQGERCEMTGYGVLVLPEDADRAQLYRVLTGVRVRGKVVAPADIKAHYGVK